MKHERLKLKIITLICGVLVLKIDTNVYVHPHKMAHAKIVLKYLMNIKVIK